MSYTIFMTIFKEKIMESDKRKNPSRKDCEKIIRRILITEVLENGKNMHFKMATDFLKYFESLYPSSDSLTKQVQRAVRSMDMPKDENGYYIVDKTNKQAKLENTLKLIFSESITNVTDLSDCVPVAISLKPELIDHCVSLMGRIDMISANISQIVRSDRGIIIYTKNKEKLLASLEKILPSEM